MNVVIVFPRNVTTSDFRNILQTKLNNEEELLFQIEESFFQIEEMLITLNNLTDCRLYPGERGIYE